MHSWLRWGLKSVTGFSVEWGGLYFVEATFPHCWGEKDQNEKESQSVLSNTKSS